MTTEQMQRLREGCVMAMSKINVWRCDGCGLMRPDLDLGMTACKCGAGRWSVFDVAAALRASEERARKAEAERDEIAAGLRSSSNLNFAMRQERDALAAANLAANKRIVALAHECEAERRKVDALLESSALLRDERDDARAELARLTTPRPIAEAPRDGTEFIGKWLDQHGEEQRSPEIMSYEEDVELFTSCATGLDLHPTHYIPLPAESGQRTEKAHP